MIDSTMKQSEKLWKDTLAVLVSKLRNHDYSTWIENRLSFVLYDKNASILYLGVTDDFQKGQLEYKYASVIEKVASEVYGTPLRAKFLLPKEQDAILSSEAPESESGTFPAGNDKIDRKRGVKPTEGSVYAGEEGEILFNPRYTFDNFIVGDNSRFAAGAAQAVAQAPGKAYSPLFIYGDSGLGKTHLMNAIGIYILKNFPKLKVLFVSSETFTEEFVNASIHKKMNVFKEKYRGVDVLLIDDIQFISEKEKTVEEVFNTYNTLYASGKQMVFTSDRPPHEILGLDERLVGRLGSGLLVDLKPPSYEIKVAILKNKATLDGVVQDEGLSEIISFIAENIKSNVRELESAFNRVVAYAKFVDVPFTKALAKQVLSDVIRMSGNGPSAKDIKKVVANYFGITVSAIDSDERTRALSMPRQIAMYLCREMTGLSFPKIAEVFKKDYSTVHHAYDKIKKETSGNDQLRQKIDELIDKLNAEY